MVRKNSQKQGEDFERRFASFLKQLIPDLGYVFIVEPLIQGSGTFQFGKDIQAKWKDARGQQFTWHFECKSHRAKTPKQIKKEEIANKLLDIERSSQEINCFCLVAPHKEFDNWVGETVEFLNQKRSFFTTRWTPAYHSIEKIFACYPTLYTQIYHKPSPKLASDERTSRLANFKEELEKDNDKGQQFKALLRRYFDNLIQTHTSTFAGRDKELKALLSFLKSPGGYRLIEGEAGIGKTALIAALIAACSDHVCYHFFNHIYSNDDFLEDDFFLRSMCQQLAVSHQKELRLPNKTPDLAACYLDLLSVEPVHPLAILIDGLDEAKFSLRPYIPSELPNDVHIILTARTVADRNWSQELGLSLTTSMILPKLSLEDVKAILQKAGNPAAGFSSNMVFLRSLHRISQGDPLYLTFVLLDDIQNGSLTPQILLQETKTLTSKREYPQGLKNYFTKWWKELADSMDNIQVQEVLGTLAVAYGALTRQDLLDSNSGFLNTWTIDNFLGKVSRFLVGNQERGYQLCHPRFQDYFREKIGPEECVKYRDRLLDYCSRWRDYWLRGKIPNHTLSYYSSYLHDAGRYNDLYELIDHDWLKAKREHLMSDSSFLHDLKLAVDASLSQQPAGLPELLRLELVSSRLTTVAHGIPPDVYELFAILGSTTVGLERIDLIDNLNERVIALAAFARGLYVKVDERPLLIEVCRRIAQLLSTTSARIFVNLLKTIFAGRLGDSMRVEDDHPWYHESFPRDVTLPDHVIRREVCGALCIEHFDKISSYLNSLGFNELRYLSWSAAREAIREGAFPNVQFDTIIDAAASTPLLKEICLLEAEYLVNWQKASTITSFEDICQQVENTFRENLEYFSIWLPDVVNIICGFDRLKGKRLAEEIAFKLLSRVREDSSRKFNALSIAEIAKFTNPMVLYHAAKALRISCSGHLADFITSIVEMNIVPVDVRIRSLLLLMTANTSEVLEKLNSVLTGSEQPSGRYDIETAHVILSLTEYWGEESPEGIIRLLINQLLAAADFDDAKLLLLVDLSFRAAELGLKPVKIIDGLLLDEMKRAKNVTSPGGVHPSRTKALIKLGLRAAFLQRFDEARTYLTQILQDTEREERNSALVLLKRMQVNFVDLFSRRNNPDRAGEVLRQMETASDTDERAHTNLAHEAVATFAINLVTQKIDQAKGIQLLESLHGSEVIRTRALCCIATELGKQDNIQKAVDLIDSLSGSGTLDFCQALAQLALVIWDKHPTKAQEFLQKAFLHSTFAGLKTENYEQKFCPVFEVALAGLIAGSDRIIEQTLNQVTDAQFYELVVRFAASESGFGAEAIEKAWLKIMDDATRRPHRASGYDPMYDAAVLLLAKRSIKDSLELVQQKGLELTSRTFTQWALIAEKNSPELVEKILELEEVSQPTSALVPIWLRVLKTREVAKDKKIIESALKDSQFARKTTSSLVSSVTDNIDNGWLREKVVLDLAKELDCEDSERCAIINKCIAKPVDEIKSLPDIAAFLSFMPVSTRFELFLEILKSSTQKPINVLGRILINSTGMLMDRFDESVGWEMYNKIKAGLQFPLTMRDLN